MIDRIAKTISYLRDILSPPALQLSEVEIEALLDVAETASTCEHCYQGLETLANVVLGELDPK